MPLRDLITGDETWVYLDVKRGIIWLLADAELPVRVKRTIASEKSMLIALWGIHGSAHYCWLPKDSTVDSPFFCEEVLSTESTRSENTAKFQKTRKPLTLIHMGNPRAHSKDSAREIGCFLFQAHAAATVSPGYCTIRPFLFGGMKTQLE
jgi:hypothetical protein